MRAVARLIFASAVALHRVPWHDLLCKCRGTALRAVARLYLPRGTSIVRRSYSRRSNSPRLWRCVPWHDYANPEGHQLSGGATPVGVLPSWVHYARTCRSMAFAHFGAELLPWECSPRSGLLTLRLSSSRRSARLAVAFCVHASKCILCAYNCA